MWLGGRERGGGFEATWSFEDACTLSGLSQASSRSAQDIGISLDLSEDKS